MTADPAVAIIPARGGSKRVPRKNIRDFAGRPMLSWTIAVARESGLFDEIVVSTDDDEIASVARDAGASVPFMRPAALADDFSSARLAINHAIKDAETRHAQLLADVCCIYPTSALVIPSDLVAARDMLRADQTARFVFAAARYPHPIQRAMRMTSSGGVEPVDAAQMRTRSQDLVETFHDVGQFYWGRRDAFIAEEPMFGPHSRPYLLPRERVVDIDTPEDWAFAEALMRIKLISAAGQA